MLVTTGDPAMASWIDAAAAELRWGVQIIETIFDPQTVILCSTGPEALTRKLLEAIHPLLPSNANRPGRAIPRLQLGMTDPWSVALGAAAETDQPRLRPAFFSHPQDTRQRARLTLTLREKP